MAKGKIPEKANLGQKGHALLKAKIRKSRKTPRFKRQEHWAQAMLKDTWRKPKGKQSKMRKHERGRGRMPSPGYGSPSAVKGLDRHGFREVHVFNPSELGSLNRERDSAIIASTVGRKKRLEILKKAESLGIRVTNP